MKEAEGSWNWLEESFEIFCAACLVELKEVAQRPALSNTEPAARANGMWVIDLAARQLGPLPGDSIGSGGDDKSCGTRRVDRPMAQCNVLRPAPRVSRRCRRGWCSLGLSLNPADFFLSGGYLTHTKDARFLLEACMSAKASPTLSLS